MKLGIRGIFVVLIICSLVIFSSIGVNALIEMNSNSYEVGNYINGLPLKETGEFSLVDLGVFKCTAYCPCTKCCGKWGGSPIGKTTATGVGAYDKATIAVDPAVIPYGSTVYIEGLGFRVATDCGGHIKNKRIDVYFTDHNEALSFSKQSLRVYLVNYR